jgi:hypothetical protein
LSDPRLHWIGFTWSKALGGPVPALLDYFGEAQIAWQAPASALRSLAWVQSWSRIYSGALERILELVWSDSGPGSRLDLDRR